MSTAKPRKADKTMADERPDMVRTPFARVGFAIWTLAHTTHRETVGMALGEAIEFAITSGDFEVAACIRDLRDALQPEFKTKP